MGQGPGPGNRDTDPGLRAREGEGPDPHRSAAERPDGTPEGPRLRREAQRVGPEGQRSGAGSLGRPPSQFGTFERMSRTPVRTAADASAGETPTRLRSGRRHRPDERGPGLGRKVTGSPGFGWMTGLKPTLGSVSSKPREGRGLGQSSLGVSSIRGVTLLGCQRVGFLP